MNVHEVNISHSIHRVHVLPKRAKVQADFQTGIIRPIEFQLKKMFCVDFDLSADFQT